MPDVCPLPFPEFKNRITGLYQGPRHADRTREKVRRVLDLVDQVGIESTADFTTEFAVRYVRQRYEAPVTANTIRGELTYLRAICNHAVDMDALERAPKWKFARPRPNPPVRTQLHSIDDVARVFRHLRASSYSFRGNRLWALAALIGLTGVRLGEAQYLRVADLRLDESYFTIDPNRRRKTEKSARFVPCPPDLLKVLRGWVPRAAAESEWLFPSSDRRRPWVSGGKDGRGRGGGRFYFPEPPPHLRDLGASAMGDLGAPSPGHPGPHDDSDSGALRPPGRFDQAADSGRRRRVLFPTARRMKKPRGVARGSNHPESSPGERGPGGSRSSSSG